MSDLKRWVIIDPNNNKFTVYADALCVTESTVYFDRKLESGDIINVAAFPDTSSIYRITEYSDVGTQINPAEGRL